MTLIKLLDLLLPLTGFSVVMVFWVALIVIGVVVAYFQVDWVPTGTGKHPLGCYLAICALAGLIISLLVSLVLRFW